MALAERMAHAMNSSDLEPSDYRTVDVDRLAAIAQGSRHGSALLRVRDAATDVRKSCDEAAKLHYAKDWNIALDIVWHKALSMARRGRWKCRPDQVIKLSRLALLQFVGGVCGACLGRGLVNAQRDGTAKGAARVCPCCNGAGQRWQSTKHIAAALGTTISDVDDRWLERLANLAGAVEGMRRVALAGAKSKLSE